MMFFNSSPPPYGSATALRPPPDDRHDTKTSHDQIISATAFCDADPAASAASATLTAPSTEIPQLPDASSIGNMPFLEWQAANTPFIPTLPGQRHVSAGGQDGLRAAPKKTGIMNACTQLWINNKIRKTDNIKAIRNIRALEKGFPNEKAYDRYVYGRCAINAGFRHSNGQANVTAYIRYMSDRTVKNPGFVTNDGQLNRTAYHRSRLERTAISAGFVNPEGAADVKAYQRNSFEQMVRRAGYVNADGTIDAGTYRAHGPERAAKKGGFLLSDGTADVHAYRDHLMNRYQAVPMQPHSATTTTNQSSAAPPLSHASVAKPLPFEWPSVQNAVHATALAAAQAAASELLDANVAFTSEGPTESSFFSRPRT